MLEAGWAVSLLFSLAVLSACFSVFKILPGASKDKAVASLSSVLPRPLSQPGISLHPPPPQACLGAGCEIDL